MQHRRQMLHYEVFFFYFLGEFYLLRKSQFYYLKVAKYKKNLKNNAKIHLIPRHKHKVATQLNQNLGSMRHRK